MPTRNRRRANLLLLLGVRALPRQQRGTVFLKTCCVAAKLNWDIARAATSYPPLPGGIGTHRSLIPERRDYFAGGYSPSVVLLPVASFFRILALVGGGGGAGGVGGRGGWKRGTTMLCSPTTDSVLTNRLFTVWPPGISIPVA